MYHKNSNKSTINDDELTNSDGSYAKFMFNSKNLRQFTRHNIDVLVPGTIHKTVHECNPKKPLIPKDTIYKPKDTISKPKDTMYKPKDTIYKPLKKDSLFWCFFILKYGYSKYEMEVGNQHFVIEKQEKFKYIDEVRKSSNKELLKMHKIKPLSLLEDDLANQERISIKTFFALCIIEKINIMLIDKRKVYEILTTDDPKIHVIHRNSLSHEHYIELDVSIDTINMYRETYYKMLTFDVSLKSMASYKVEELLELCKKLQIVLEDGKDSEKKEEKEKKKKLSKKDIYELLVQQF